MENVIRIGTGLKSTQGKKNEVNNGCLAFCGAQMKVAASASFLGVKNL